jgi:hypothetical protein
MMARADVDSRRWRIATGLRRMESTRTYNISTDKVEQAEELSQEYSRTVEPQDERRGSYHFQEIMPLAAVFRTSRHF